MKTLTNLRVLLSAAIVCGIASQAGVSSATAFCRALWPEKFINCQSSLPTMGASGEGRNIGGGGDNRLVSVKLAAAGSGVKAQAAALNSAGVAIAGCIIQDTTPDAFGETELCFTANPPTSYFIVVE